MPSRTVSSSRLNATKAVCRLAACTSAASSSLSLPSSGEPGEKDAPVRRPGRPLHKSGCDRAVEQARDSALLPALVAMHAAGHECAEGRSFPPDSTVRYDEVWPAPEWPCPIGVLLGTGVVGGAGAGVTEPDR